ncbi:hypothetical protein [Streptomyces liangshanensis]|uniref:hypothetical protein n=1 Tax=Streptomyces liangshanensis TaxID=2717324 RepID=UPI003C7C5C7B
MTARQARGVEVGAGVCVRRRLYVVDGLVGDLLPARRIADRFRRGAGGPGGIYARLAELGIAPVHFREEIRSRMPPQTEAERWGLPGELR